MKLQHFGHLMRRVDSLEKTLMLEGIGHGSWAWNFWDFPSIQQAVPDLGHRREGHLEKRLQLRMPSSLTSSCGPRMAMVAFLSPMTISPLP